MQTVHRTAYALMMLTASYAAAAADITLAWIGAADGDARNGVEQGLNEANLQGKFLGYSIAMQNYQNPEQFGHAGQGHAILTDMRGENLAQILRQNLKTPVFYIGNQDHGLKAAQCTDNLLRLLPPEASMKAATNAWLESKPDKDGAATAWHPRFVKFAARDLNKRYKAAFSTAMAPSAWAGWAAVKAIATAFSSQGEQAILMFAEPKQRASANLGFDGQKGRNMVFREDGVLPQLILIGNGDKLLGEAPGIWPTAGQRSECAAN